jgi:hypothetical protein
MEKMLVCQLGPQQRNRMHICRQSATLEMNGIARVRLKV